MPTTIRELFETRAIVNEMCLMLLSYWGGDRCIVCFVDACSTPCAPNLRRNEFSLERLAQTWCVGRIGPKEPLGTASLGGGFRNSYVQPCPAFTCRDPIPTDYRAC